MKPFGTAVIFVQAMFIFFCTDSLFAHEVVEDSNASDVILSETVSIQRSRGDWTPLLRTTAAVTDRVEVKLSGNACAARVVGVESGYFVDQLRPLRFLGNGSYDDGYYSRPFALRFIRFKVRSMLRESSCHVEVLAQRVSRP